MNRLRGFVEAYYGIVLLAVIAIGAFVVDWLVH